MKYIVVSLTVIAISLVKSNSVDDNEHLGPSAAASDENVIDTEVQYDDIESRIYGGKAAKKGQFPWQAALRIATQCFLSYFNLPVAKYDSFSCGASLISTKHLITAAHCLNFKNDKNIVYKATKVFVKLGSTSTEQGAIDIPTEHYTLHHSWNVNIPVPKHDIGIIYLAEPYTKNVQGTVFEKLISPIALPHFRDNFVGEFATASGYGKSDKYGDKNLQLNFVEMKVISKAECNYLLMEKRVGPVVDESHICTSNLDGRNRPVVSVCFGDSGGPLTIRKQVKNKHGETVSKDILIGVSSFVSDETCVNGPSMFTRITHFMPFILSKVPSAELDLTYPLS